ncbi:MAG: hypothetical protein QW273_03750, partial [Candidatus Pacearchaeota archaeon]
EFIKAFSPQYGDIYLYLHVSPNEAKRNLTEQEKKIREGYKVSNIFYKDGLNFFRLIKEGYHKFEKTTLKDYSKKEIFSSVLLRDKEINVLNLQKKDLLAYYQPSTIEEGGRLKEGIVLFKFLPLNTNYNHIESSREGYYNIKNYDRVELKTRKRTKKEFEIPEDKFSFLEVKKGVLIPYIKNENEKINNEILNEKIQEFLRNTNTKIENWDSIEEIKEYLFPER